jgi:hypothetical protein
MSTIPLFMQTETYGRSARSKPPREKWFYNIEPFRGSTRRVPSRRTFTEKPISPRRPNTNSQRTAKSDQENRPLSVAVQKSGYILAESE